MIRFTLVSCALAWNGLGFADLVVVDKQKKHFVVYWASSPSDLVQGRVCASIPKESEIGARNCKGEDWDAGGVTPNSFLNHHQKGKKTFDELSKEIEEASYSLANEDVLDEPKLEAKLKNLTEELNSQIVAKRIFDSWLSEAQYRVDINFLMSKGMMLRKTPEVAKQSVRSPSAGGGMSAGGGISAGGGMSAGGGISAGSVQTQSRPVARIRWFPDRVSDARNADYLIQKIEANDWRVFKRVEGGLAAVVTDSHTFPNVTKAVEAVYASGGESYAVFGDEQ